MADAGDIRLTATIDTRGYDSGANRIRSANSSIESSTAGAASSINKAHGQAGASNDEMVAKSESGSAKLAAIWGAVAGVAQHVVSRAFDMVKDSISGAVDRVDTLNNFPKIMSNLGYSSADAATQVQRMSDRLQGLPTSLQAMTGMVQKIAPLTGSLSEATDISLAFNDALLAGGKSTELQSNALEQYSQMLSVGKVDMQAWRSVVNAMPGQMDQLSKSILGNNANQQDLYNAMKSGRVTFKQFNDAVVDLDKNGSGHFASFQEQARSATGGIKTGWMNMQNAIDRGIADIIQAIGSSNISEYIAGIGTSFENAAKAIAPVVGAIVRFVSSASKLPAVKGTVAALAGAFAALAVSMKISATIKSITSAFAAFKEAQQASTVAQAAFNAVMSANPLTVVVVAISAVVAALAYFFTQTDTGRKAWSSFTSWLGQAWQNVKNVAQNVWGAITGFVSGAADGVKGAWNGITGFFSNIWNGIGAGVSGAINGIKSAWSGVTGFFSNIWNGITTGVSNAWNTITGVIKGAAGFIGSIAANILTVLGAIPVWLLQHLLGGIDGVFSAIYSTIQGWFNNTTGVVHTVLGGALNFVSAFWNTIHSVVQGAIDTVRTIIVTVVQLLQGNWQGAWTTMSTFFQGVWSNIVAFFTGIVNNFQNIWNTVWAAVSGVWNTVWGGISSFFMGIWNGIVSFISPIIATIENIISTDIAAIQAVWNSIWSAISGFIGPIWAAISSTVSGAINAVSGAISGTLGAIQGVWNSVWGAVSGFLGGIWNGIVNAVRNGINAVSNIVSNIRGTVLGAVSGAGSWLYDTGRNIISGLIGGVTGAFNWLKNTITNMGHNVLNWAKSVLHIGSPSKVFRDEVGKWIPAGIQVGIDKNMPSLKADLTDNLQSLVPDAYHMTRFVQDSTSSMAPTLRVPSVPATLPANNTTTTKRIVSAPIDIHTDNPTAAGYEASRIINRHFV